MSRWEGAQFSYNPVPVTFEDLEPGVTTCWMYVHEGKAGPAIAVPGQWLTDDDGIGTFVQTGEPQQVTVIDDGA